MLKSVVYWLYYFGPEVRLNVMVTRACGGCCLPDGRQKAERQEGTSYPYGPTPSNLLPPARTHLQKIPASVKRAPPAGDQAFNTWNFFGNSLLFYLLFWDRVSLCTPGWPWTHNPPASAFWILGFQACATMFSLGSLIYLASASFVQCWGNKSKPVWTQVSSKMKKSCMIWCWAIKIKCIIISVIKDAKSNYTHRRARKNKEKCKQRTCEWVLFPLSLTFGVSVLIIVLFTQ
jgi:hypothetical protein